MHAYNNIKLTIAVCCLLAAIITDATYLISEITIAFYFCSLIIFQTSDIKPRTIVITTTMCCLIFMAFGVWHDVQSSQMSATALGVEHSSSRFVFHSNTVTRAIISISFLFLIQVIRKNLQNNEDSSPETLENIHKANDTTNGAESQIITKSLELVGDEKIKFERFANALPIYTSTFNADGSIDFISQNYETFFGIDLEVIKQNWQSLIHQDDAPYVFKKWSETLKSCKDSTFSYRVVNKHNEVRYFHSHCTAVKINKTGDYKWLISTFDNSETEFLRLENDKLVAKLQGILEGMEDGFISLTPNNDDFAIEYYNFRAELLVDLPRNADMQSINSCGEFFANQDLRNAISEVHTNQETKTLTMRFEGNELLIRVHASPNGVRLFIQDITSEKASLNELTLLRSAIDKANDVVLITKAEPINKDGPIIVYANDAFENVTGFNKTEIIGKTARILQGPKTESKSKKILTDAMKNSNSVRVLITNYTKDGTPFDNEVDLSPLKNDKGETTHFIAIERDISKQKAQEEMAFRAHKMDSIGLVTGGVAHDFNNLLTIILGNADLLLSNKQHQLNSEAMEKANAIFEAANQGISLTRSLLAFSKRQPLKSSAVDMEKLLFSVEPIIRTALGAEIKLSVTNHAKHMLVTGDQSQLESLFLNMAVNARDAMLSKIKSTAGSHEEFIGELKIVLENKTVSSNSILASSLKPGEFLEIIFRDNGSGIDDEHIEKIFDPFFSTKPLTKGTGLGLSMIYSFITQNGGHIEVKSKLGIGTDFNIYLPIAKKEKQDVIKNTNKQAKISDTFYAGKTVLIVEDTEMVAKVAQHIFKEAGFNVIIAEDGPTALNKFAEKPIDLLFTDIILPNGMNGKEIAEKLRTDQPTLPIIYTSGFTDGKLKHEDYQQENVDFLQKPYTKKQLLEILEKIHL